MIRNLDTALLRAVVTAAEAASITVAANALNLTQGAVSQQVRRLEETLGCTLFERDRRGLKLTPDGERLFGKAKRLLALNDEIWREMTHEAVHGRLRLGIPYDLAGAWLSPMLKAYSEACPQVEVTLYCGSSPELAGQLASGTIDLAVVEEVAGPTAGECLGIERLAWVGAKGGDAYRKRPLPLSIVSETCAFRPAMLGSLRDHGLVWRTVFEDGSLEATWATVEADMAVSAWLPSTVPASLTLLGPDSGLPPLPSFSINLHRPRHGASAAAEAFAGLLRQRRAA